MSTGIEGEVIELKERVADLEQLVRDLDALCSDRMPYTYNQGKEGLLLRERIRELGIKSDRAVQP